MIDKSVRIVNPASFHSLSLVLTKRLVPPLDNFNRSKMCLLHILPNWYSHWYILKEFWRALVKLISVSLADAICLSSFKTVSYFGVSVYRGDSARVHTLPLEISISVAVLNLFVTGLLFFWGSAAHVPPNRTTYPVPS